MSTSRYTASTRLNGGDRAAQADEWLRTVLGEWELPPGLGRRWLAAAGEHLHGDAADEVFLQWDTVMGLVTVELWCEGRVVYGIDDFIGAGSGDLWGV